MTLEEELEETKRLLRCYEELAVDQQDDESFIARGNGFCESKYSDDFIEMRIAQLTARAAQLESKKQ